MSNEYYERHIDTSSDGLIFQIEHNLDGHPVPVLWEPTVLGDMKIVPLYDPRIAAIETKGPDVMQLSFAAPFSGKIQLQLFKAKDYSLEQQVQDIDRRVKDLIVNHRQLVSKNQWSKMNSYQEAKIEEVQKTLDILSDQVDGLAQDVESL